ncbi:hypothetical protein [Winogradskyella sp. SM1960]|uniref:hypothetical protein n=1 Tax=Winogradskyella sp. SM1960 TaxID=2865955 RepID=UPI001CD73292|nr:hypothetical protein [Winogradskyella sp. SM1960]
MKIFKEEQRFNQLWLIVLILVSLLVPVGVILLSYFEDPSSYTNLELTSSIGFIILAAGIIFLFKLETRIDEKGIHYKFFPFHWSFKVVTWNDIEKAYVRTYSPISEYGGWGIKGGILWNTSKGKAINVSGDIGIQLELKNGKKLLIGTQKRNEAERILTTYKTKFN